MLKRHSYKIIKDLSFLLYGWRVLETLGATGVDTISGRRRSRYDVMSGLHGRPCDLFALTNTMLNSQIG